MGVLEGRVAIVTGAGGGLGREHALLFAEQGAKVVVNDLGGDAGGGGASLTPAQETVAMIEAMGGEAVVNGANVADWDAAGAMIRQAVDTFGDLHVLVNNAGILRDRVIVNMSEAEWDAVVTVHLKGHFAPTQHAAAYWRQRAKDLGGDDLPDRSIVHTSSTSGVFANPGQANYGAAKSGIATLSQICAKELGRYNVRSNSICPGARTRLTLATPGLGDAVAAPQDPAKFDIWDPANVAPFVAYLASEQCRISGETFMVQGGVVQRIQTWTAAQELRQDHRWTVDELAARADELFA